MHVIYINKLYQDNKSLKIIFLCFKQANKESSSRSMLFSTNFQILIFAVHFYVQLCGVCSRQNKRHTTGNILHKQFVSVSYKFILSVAVLLQEQRLQNEGTNYNIVLCLTSQEILLGFNSPVLALVSFFVSSVSCPVLPLLFTPG